MRALLDIVDANTVLAHADEYSAEKIAEAERFIAEEPARRARAAKHNYRGVPVEWAMTELSRGGVHCQRASTA